MKIKFAPEEQLEKLEKIKRKSSFSSCVQPGGSRGQGGRNLKTALSGQRRGTPRKLSGNQEWQDTGYVFTQKDGIPMNPETITQWLHKFSKRNDMPELHPHLFRHTHASILVAAHVDIVSISQRLGHAKVSTTEDFYAHALKDADRKASDTFSRVLDSSIAI